MHFVAWILILSKTSNGQDHHYGDHKTYHCGKSHHFGNIWFYKSKNLKKIRCIETWEFEYYRLVQFHWSILITYAFVLSDNIQILMFQCILFFSDFYFCKIKYYQNDEIYHNDKFYDRHNGDIGRWKFCSRWGSMLRNASRRSLLCRWYNIRRWMRLV
jgi:hypothetical protein